MDWTRVMIGGLMVMLTACGSGSSGGTDGTTTSNITGDDGEGENFNSDADVDASLLTTQGDSATFKFDDTNSARLTFAANTADTDEFLLVIYPPETGDSSGATFAFDLNSPKTKTTPIDRAVSDDEDEEDDFDLFLREAEAELAEDPNFTIATRASFRSDGDPDAAVSVGSTRSFSVLDSLSSTKSCTSVTAEAVLVTDNFVLYSDQQCPLGASDISAFSPLDAVFSTLDATIGAASDVDGNDQFFILATCAVNALGAAQSGFVTGYFYGGDLTGTTCSNQSEIIYMNVPDPNKNHGSVAISNKFWRENLVPTVPPHERQHMVSYNHHVIEGGTSSEESPWNECYSHLVEDIADDYNVSMENPSRAKRFLNDPATAQLFDGTSLAQRGGCYLFMRYLCDTADEGLLPGVSDCSELAGELIATSERSHANMANVTGLSFEALFGRFTLALGVSGRGLTQDPVQTFTSFNPYDAAFDDNRGTEFAGPDIQEFSSTGSFEVNANSVLLLSLTGEQIANMGGVITINGNNGLEPRAHLIRIQ